MMNHTLTRRTVVRVAGTDTRGMIERRLRNGEYLVVSLGGFFVGFFRINQLVVE